MKPTEEQLREIGRIAHHAYFDPRGYARDWELGTLDAGRAAFEASCILVISAFKEANWIQPQEFVANLIKAEKDEAVEAVAKLWNQKAGINGMTLQVCGVTVEEIVAAVDKSRGRK